MFISDIKRVVEQVGRDKGIDSEILIKALEDALKSAARKKFGSNIDIEVKYNEESGEIEVFQFKEVVENITEPDLQLSLEEAYNLDPESKIGDSLGTKMDASTFGRIAAQSAKQVIIQKMKDAERDAVYSSFIDRKFFSANSGPLLFISLFLFFLCNFIMKYDLYKKQKNGLPPVSCHSIRSLHYIDFQIINFTRPEGGRRISYTSTTDNTVKLFIRKSIDRKTLSVHVNHHKK